MNSGQWCNDCAGTGMAPPGAKNSLCATCKGTGMANPPKTEGAAPLSHDSSVERAIRKHQTPRSKRHMSGSDRYRRPDPMKKIQMRTRRASRHQPRPEIDEAATFLIKNWGKPLTEDDLKTVSDRSLLTHAVDALANIAFGGWKKSEQGVTNDSYVLEGEDLSLKDGNLHYKNSPVQLNWDWLYSVRQLLQKGQ